MYLTFGVAVIIILKHATFLLLSNLSPKSALTQAETDYQAGNIGSEIQQFLTASPQSSSIKQFASFIKANEIVPSQPSAEIQKKDHWLKQFWKPILLHKSTKQHKKGSADPISSGSGVASGSGM
ncbi:hypothetical protein V8E53_007681 [Lactarius tabidus]